MGYGVPAAVGVSFARPEEEVWAIVGDGGFQMSIPELATIAQERRPVKIAVMRNGYLGMVRQWQELIHGKRYSEVSISSPDLVKLCDAYGILGCGPRPRSRSPRSSQRRARSGSSADGLRCGAGSQRLSDG